MVAGPDNRLVFESWRTKSTIWRIEAGPEETLSGIPVIGAVDRYLAPQLSHRADQLAYLVSKGDGNELWTSALDGTSAKLWPVNPHLRAGSPKWSKDDDSLLYVELINGHPQIHLLNLKNSLVQVLTDDLGGAVTPAWSATGSSFYYSADHGAGWQIWRRTINGSVGNAQQITVDGGFAAQESLDGEHLFYTKTGVGGLWHLKKRAERPSQLPIKLALWDWGNWAISASTIYYQSRIEGVHLKQFDFTSLEHTASHRLNGRFSNPGLTVAAGGSPIFGAQEYSREVNLHMIRSLPRID
jgi:Tol biopolymer transport system component